MDQQESEIIQLKAKLWDMSVVLKDKNTIIGTIAKRLEAEDYNELIDNLNEAIAAKQLIEGEKCPEDSEHPQEKTRQ